VCGGGRKRNHNFGSVLVWYVPYSVVNLQPWSHLRHLPSENQNRYRKPGIQEIIRTSRDIFSHLLPPMSEETSSIFCFAHAHGVARQIGLIWVVCAPLLMPSHAVMIQSCIYYLTFELSTAPTASQHHSQLHLSLLRDIHTPCLR
jgi:hypothetical protein